MNKINALLPVVEKMANEWLAKCTLEGLDVIVTSTYRTNEEQDALYAQGRTTAGSIVTKAKGGQSMHNYKVALDFVPLKNGKACWDDLALFKRVAGIGKSVGFTWGGDWASFPDMPHLEYTAGYTLADFQNGNVDYTKFDIQPTYTQTVTITPPVEPKIALSKAEIVSMIQTFLAVFGTAVMANIGSLDFNNLTKGALIGVLVAALRATIKSLWVTYTQKRG